MGNLCVPGGAAEEAKPGDLVLQGLMVKAWMDLNGNKDPNGTLPLPGLRRLLRKLAICLSAEEMKRRFEVYDKDCDGKVSFADAWGFMRSCLSVPLPELEELFLTFARESELMPVAAFAHLLVAHQHQIRKGAGAPNAALARVLNIRSIIRRRANQRDTPLSRLAAATHETRTSAGLSSAGIDEQLCYNLRQGCVPTLLNEGRAGDSAGRQDAVAGAGGRANPLIAATARASIRQIAQVDVVGGADADKDGAAMPAAAAAAAVDAEQGHVSAAQLVAMRLKAQADGQDTVSLREATDTVIAGHAAEAALSRRRLAGAGPAVEQTPQPGSKAAAILLGNSGGDSHAVVEAGRADEEEELRTLRVLAEGIDDARPGISFLEFVFYMTEPVTNGLGNPRLVNTTWQNMKRPLSSYFICTARQAAVQDLQQRAVSVAALRRCVAMGARALELEIAELQDKGGVSRLVVCPPRSGVTSKLRASQCLSLRETMAAAVEAGFSSNPFPLLLLLRSNITSQRGQEALAKQLRQIFGGVLYTSQEERQRVAAVRAPSRRRSTTQRVEPDDRGTMLPSPFELRERVLLFLESPLETKRVESIHPALANTVFSTLSAVQEVQLDDSGAVQLPQLAAVGEEAVLRVGERGPSHAAAMLRATQRNLLFVEPSPTRIMSRNQPAEPLWNLGAQMVGCNFFNCDMRTLIYHSFFQNNGGCGYVLKPALMQPRHSPSSYDASGRDTAVRQRLTLRIISAQNLPVLSTVTSKRVQRRGSAAGPPEVVEAVQGAEGGDSRVVAGGLAAAVSPVVEVQIIGAKCDCKTFTTEVVENNGYNPRWGGLSSTGSKLELELRRPEMAVLSFVVRHKASSRGATPFLAYGGTPAPAILPGIRCIQLFDACSAPLPRSRLFVRVDRSAGTASRGPSYQQKL